MYDDIYQAQKERDEELRQQSVRQNQFIERFMVTVLIICVVCLIGLFYMFWGK